MRGKSTRHIGRTAAPTSFNEARALCAGSDIDSHRVDVRQVSFNEARALCAGSRPSAHLFSIALIASMRPAHYAREVCRNICTSVRAAKLQ